MFTLPLLPFWKNNNFIFRVLISDFLSFSDGPTNNQSSFFDATKTWNLKRLKAANKIIEHNVCLIFHYWRFLERRCHERLLCAITRWDFNVSAFYHMNVSHNCVSMRSSRFGRRKQRGFMVCHQNRLFSLNCITQILGKYTQQARKGIIKTYHQSPFDSYIFV